MKGQEQRGAGIEGAQASCGISIRVKDTEVCDGGREEGRDWERQYSATATERSCFLPESWSACSTISLMRPQKVKMVAVTALSSSSFIFSFNSRPTFCHFLEWIKGPSIINQGQVSSMNMKN